MKKAILIFLLTIGVFAAKAQETQRAAQLPPDMDMVKFFYTAYMMPFVNDADLRQTTRKQTLLRRTYCTPRCITRYEQLTQETGADAFIKAQDSNLEAVKSVEVTKDPKVANRYTVTYNLPEKVSIDLSLVNEKGEWKIDYLY
jgi:hypothetical protein